MRKNGCNSYLMSTAFVENIMFFLPKKKNTLLLILLVNIARKYFVTVKKHMHN